MTVRRAVSLVAVLLLVSSPNLVAQQGQHRGQEPMMHGQGHGMADMAGLQSFSPENLLNNRAALNLTERQVGFLMALRDATAKTYDASMAGHDRNHHMLMELLGGPEPDLAKVRGYFDAAHASMGAAHWARMEAGLEAAKVLTPTQRKLVDGLPAMP